MKQKQISWAAFKSIVGSDKARIKEIAFGNEYSLNYFDGGFSIEAVLDRDPTDSTDLYDYETNYQPFVNAAQTTPAFADKTLPDGMKLYKRMMGVSQALIVGSNSVVYTIPFPHVKMSGVEIIGSELGDYSDFFILDDTSGTYSTVPSLQLNQFGWSVQMSKDYHEEKSNYDADLYYGMQIKLGYNSITNKTVGFNFDLNEVKL